MKIIAVLIIGLSSLPAGNAILGTRGYAIADIAPVSPSSAPCKCKIEKLVFGRDKYDQWVTLLPATVKKISDYSTEFTFLLDSREVGTQVRCQGSRLKLFTLSDRKWIDIESPAIFRMVGTACEKAGF